MKRFFKLSLLSLILGILLLFGVQSHATLTLYLDAGGGNNVTVVDGDLDGVANYLGSVGPNWTMVSITAYTKPFLGTAGRPQIDAVVGTPGTGTLTILASEVGFGPATGTIQFNATVGGTLADNASATFKYFLDSGNSLWGPGGTGGSHGQQLASLSFSQPPTFFSGGASGSGSVNGPYSLTLEADITQPSGGASSFDQNLRAPEPTTLILLGSGLAALGIWARRRFRR